MLAAAPCADLLPQPRWRMHPVYCLCLGEKLTCLEGVAAPGH
jgi:hypothetical protein